MTPLRAGDVVIGFFAGARQDKTRPGVVVTSMAYHAHRPDVIVCVLTTQVAGADAPTDYALVDWQQAGLRQPSAFRVFLNTVRASQVTKIGRLSDGDWAQVQARLRLALEFE